MSTNSELLSLYNIELKKESKASATIRLLNKREDSKISKILYDKLLLAIKNRNLHDIKLPDVTFGIEFEFVGSRAAVDLSNFNTAMSALFKERYFYSGSYTHNDGSSWVLGRDGSIRYANSYLAVPYGYELSTPKLRLHNSDDINNLAKVIEYIRTYLHGEVNLSCGTHIHIGFSNNDLNLSDIYRFTILDLLSSYSKMEKVVFDPIVPSSRRRNRYCKATKPKLREKYQKLSSRFCEFTYDGESRSLHFEFRQLEGTLDLNIILNWTTLQAYVLYDLLLHIYDPPYIESLSTKNIFDILLCYNFNNDLINFFIDRVIEFKSRSIQQS